MVVRQSFEYSSLRQSLQLTLRLWLLLPLIKSTREDIRKGIVDAGTGLNPTDDGHILRITIPPLSTERREELHQDDESQIRKRESYDQTSQT